MPTLKLTLCYFLDSTAVGYVYELNFYVNQLGFKKP